MTKKKIIDSYQTKDGGSIVVTPKTKRHLKAHPEVTSRLLRDAIRKIILPKNGGFLLREVKFAKVIGYSGKVTTAMIKSDAEATFAIRTGRGKPSRVVRTKKRRVRKVVIIASGVNKKYELITAYIGARAPKEPWDRTILSDKEFRESLRFWCRNAMIYNKKVMGKPFKSSWNKIISGSKMK